MYSGKLGEHSGNIFLWFLQGVIYKTIKSQNTVFVRVRGGGEGGSGNSGWWVLRLSLQGLKGGEWATKIE